MYTRTDIRIKTDTCLEVVFVGKPKLAHVEWTGQGYEKSDADDASDRLATNVWITAEERIAIIEGPRSMAQAL